MSTNGDKRACPGCGADLSGTHGKRKWCSERCRRHTMYAKPCKTCGASVYDGTASPPDECGACIHERKFGERNRHIEAMAREGRPHSEIAAAVGIPETLVSSLLNHWRQRGNDIPLAKLGGNQEERRERHLLMIQRRREGKKDAEIAEEFGYSSKASVNQTFHYLRKVGWDVPRLRPSRPRIASREQVLALVEAGKPYREIADELGYAGAGCISSIVWYHRHRTEQQAA